MSDTAPPIGKKSAPKSHTALAHSLATAMRRYSTSAVLFHYAMAERLGLGPTDHKCFDLLNERGEMTGSDLAELTGLTTGAITGVVMRLERAGFIGRRPDPKDGRKQFLFAHERAKQELTAAFEPLHQAFAQVLQSFDEEQLKTVKAFLEGVTSLGYRQIAFMRGESMQIDSVAPVLSHHKIVKRRRTDDAQDE